MNKIPTTTVHRPLQKSLSVSNRKILDLRMKVVMSAPERSTPMGGDAMGVQDFDYDFGTTSCGTITLGGLETVTGKQGFVASAHVIAGAFYPRNYTRIDAFVGHNRYKHSHKIKYFLGKVFKMPGFRTEGEKKVLNVDAAFVAYPHPKTPGCSLTWSGDEEEFCLDLGHSDYIERVVPLTVRGKNGKTHKVIGSKEPTVGIDVQMTGSVVGQLLQTIRLTEAELCMEDVIIMNMATLLVLMATLSSVVTAAVLFTPFQTRQEMSILLA